MSNSSSLNSRLGCGTTGPLCDQYTDLWRLPATKARLKHSLGWAAATQPFRVSLTARDEFEWDYCLAAPGTVGRGQPASHRVWTTGWTYSLVFLKKLDRLLSSMRICESVSFQVCKPVKPLCGDCTAQRFCPTGSPDLDW